MQSIFQKLSHLGRQSTGNEVSVFHKPADAMDDIWAQIDKAEKEVLMLTYILKDDDVGRTTMERLRAAAARGVFVRLMYDDAGNITGRTKLVEGVPNVTLFRPFWQCWIDYVKSGFSFLESPVLRNHRKIIVIDNKTGYIGGLNVGNEYAGRPCTGPYLTSGKTFRDIMVKVNGPVVSDLRQMVNETFELPLIPDDRDTRESWSGWVQRVVSKAPSSTHVPSPVGSLQGPAPVEVVTGVSAQLTGCDPWGKDYSIQKSIYVAVEEAKERVWVTTPYYAPPEHLAKVLEDAARRGVDVRVLVGGKGTTDPPIMRFVQRNWFPSALDAGIKIYEYGNVGEVMHAKMVTVDGAYSTVGSYNLDLLSDRILEANLAASSPPLNALIEQQFLHDLSLSRPVVSDFSPIHHPLTYAATKASLGIYSTARWVLGGDYDAARHM